MYLCFPQFFDSSLLVHNYEWINDWIFWCGYIHPLQNTYFIDKGSLRISKDIWVHIRHSVIQQMSNELVSPISHSTVEKKSGQFPVKLEWVTALSTRYMSSIRKFHSSGACVNGRKQTVYWIALSTK